MNRLWLGFVLVLFVSFVVLGWIGTRIHDEMPPLVEAAFADRYDRDLHDLRQRFWYVQLSKRF